MCLVDRASLRHDLIPRWTPRAPPYRDLQGTALYDRTEYDEDGPKMLSSVTSMGSKSRSHTYKHARTEIRLPRQPEHLR
jgi:hypothetical protein